MEGIRAFVGHSFSEDDQDVVRPFLEYFTDLAKSHPNFSWDHAEEAQPFSISGKVLAKFEGKNVFIGICTGREAVTQLAMFQPALWGNGNRLSPFSCSQEKEAKSRSPVRIKSQSIR